MLEIKIPPILLLILLGPVLLGMAARDSEFDHPCHPGGSGGPGGPGSPPAICPTPQATNDSPANNNASPKTLPVGFRLINQTGENITLWLGYPIAYVLNVPANSIQMFTIDRSVYSYSLLSCGVETAGFMNLTVHSYFQVEACQKLDLARITVENQSPWSLEVNLDGAAEYVLFLMPGQSKIITVAKGEYTIHFQGCLQPAESLSFTAGANATIPLNCP